MGTPAKEDIEFDTAPPDLASKLVVPANEDAIRGAMTMAIWAVPRIEPWLDILTASLSHDRKRLRERAESRDDIPAVLLGLQHLYSHEETREKLFSVLEEHTLPGTNRNVGRPGMELWRILVMGVLKQGLGCDFDRLHELVNQHRTVREFLGHGAFSQGDTYELQTIIDNVYLLTLELLSEIGQLVVESGHAVARKKPGEPLRERCRSVSTRSARRDARRAGRTESKPISNVAATWSVEPRRVARSWSRQVLRNPSRSRL